MNIIKEIEINGFDIKIDFEIEKDKNYTFNGYDAEPYFLVTEIYSWEIVNCKAAQKKDLTLELLYELAEMKTTIENEIEDYIYERLEDEMMDNLYDIN